MMISHIFLGGHISSYVACMIMLREFVGGEWICLDLGPMERPNVLEKRHRFEIGQGDGRPGEECQM